jgi:hypothetical protein
MTKALQCSRLKRRSPESRWDMRFNVSCSTGATAILNGVDELAPSSRRTFCRLSFQIGRVPARQPGFGSNGWYFGRRYAGRALNAVEITRGLKNRDDGVGGRIVQQLFNVGHARSTAHV